ncbi:hypothetical protein SSBR45G_09450 [Bradyrhizobium sp. SSBR45G]|uniref:DUF1127 domain-containing protein n=1 Tax=unclassified Bradyrhizobium TaxID=2631580 RepID=UPI002342B5FB|nr:MULTISPECIES: DUF1127 domain-containing protein [unclassified Bradyrhizobium]GLH76037.1 hypothetical protein SSBR45G_09450 [Bradyrhizobium sp. SSBR45G]GLH89188.1 hypothetical protein SSBR45R_66490 [Bradyrhizobium sp. SSBR45R]
MFIAAIFDVIKRYAHYRAQLACLERLDDRTLRDIGINRDQMYAQAWERAGLAHA